MLAYGSENLLSGLSKILLIILITSTVQSLDQRIFSFDSSQRLTRDLENLRLENQFWLILKNYFFGFMKTVFLFSNRVLKKKKIKLVEFERKIQLIWNYLIEINFRKSYSSGVWKQNLYPARESSKNWKIILKSTFKIIIQIKMKLFFQFMKTEFPCSWKKKT